MGDLHEAALKNVEAAIAALIAANGSVRQIDPSRVPSSARSRPGSSDWLWYAGNDCQRALTLLRAIKHNIEKDHKAEKHREHQEARRQRMRDANKKDSEKTT